VQNNAATPAGTNLMGKVGIDQTTPGTTNKVVSSYASPGTTFYAHHDFTAAQTDHEVLAADAALIPYITDIIITNDSSAAITVVVEADTASAKTKLLGTLYIPASGGIAQPFQTPIKGTAAKNIGVTSTGTSNWSITLSGYLAA
jgi:hypothetical protein